MGPVGGGGRLAILIPTRGPLTNSEGFFWFTVVNNLKVMNMKIITKAELARVANVSRSAITKAANGPIAAAVVNGKINIEHALVIEWLSSKNIYIDGVKAKQKADVIKSQEPTTIGGIDIKELEHLTIKEIGMQYGTLDGFKIFVETLRSISTYNFKNMRRKTLRSTLIDRDLVSKSIFSLIDVANDKLTSELPQVLVKNIVTRVQNGGNVLSEDVEKMIRDSISRELKNTKKIVINEVI